MSYNGWSNYETWNAKLWMDNDEGSYYRYREIAQEAWEESDHDLDETVDTIAKRIDEEFGSMPDGISGMCSDLLQSSLNAIDWREIAESIADDEGFEEETEDEDKEEAIEV